MTTIFNDMFTGIDETLLTVIGSKTASIINIISPVIMSCFILYVVLVTMSYMKNGTDIAELGGDLIQRFIGWSVIIALSMNIGFFTDTVVPMVNGIPDELTQAITGNTDSTTANSLDALITMYLDAINTMLNDIDVLDVGGYLLALFIGVILLVGGGLFAIAACGYILLAKIATAILLVLAPIFISLALFPTTRNFASLWVAQVVNHGLLLLLTAVLANVEVAYLTRMISNTPELSLEVAVNISLVSLVFFVLLRSLPNMASALAGGMTLNGYGQAGKSLANGARNAGGMAKGAGAVAGGAGRAGVGAYNALRNRFNKIQPEAAGK